MTPHVRQQQAEEEEEEERQAHVRAMIQEGRASSSSAPPTATKEWKQQLDTMASKPHTGPLDDEDGKSTGTMSAGWGSDTSLSSSDSQEQSGGGMLRNPPRQVSSLEDFDDVEQQLEVGREPSGSFYSSSKAASPPSADNVLSFRRKMSSTSTGVECAELTNRTAPSAPASASGRLSKRLDRWTPWNMLGGSPRRLERRDSDADICLKIIEDHSDETLEDGNEEPGDEETVPLTAEQRRGAKNYLIATSMVEDEGKGAVPVTPTPVPPIATPSAAESVILFGYDISRLSPPLQFILCAAGVFGFTIVYGYLQELLSVHILGRKYALFLATCQFGGYFFWSFVLAKMRSKPESPPTCSRTGVCDVPLGSYVALSLIRAVDLGLTNGAMQFLNYPAKTLIKSSRVVFTLLIGLVIGKKRYSVNDYAAVLLLVCGLGIFLHADSRASAVFHPLGVAMLVVSLTCDGTVSNWSELIMRKHAVSQDEFNFYLYGIALTAMTVATHARGELVSGMRIFFATDGTVTEVEAEEEPTWTITGKVLVMILFSTTGIFGASCCGAITKRFGALAMSITSTARKATTLFLSFALFPTNNCTLEHVVGMIIFLGALVMKSIGKAKASSLSTSTTKPSLEKLKKKTSFVDAGNQHGKKEQKELFEIVPVVLNKGNGPSATKLRLPSSSSNGSSHGGKSDSFRVV